MLKNHFPSKEYLENKEVMEFYHNFEDKSIFENECCQECKGRCCKKCGCSYYVEDFEDLSLNELKTELNKGDKSIVSTLEVSYANHRYCVSPILMIRVRNEGRGVVDLFSEKTRCSLLTKDGCPYSFENRPTGGIMLIPFKNGSGFDCKTLETANQIAIDGWKRYQKVLARLVKYYTGRSLDERLKEEVGHTIDALASHLLTAPSYTTEQVELLGNIQYMNDDLTAYARPDALALCKKASTALGIYRSI